MKPCFPAILAVLFMTCILGAGESSVSAADQESPKLLAFGAGVSWPSFTSALHQNPAGLIANSRPKLHGDVASQESDLDPKTVGGGLFLGSDSIGGGVAYSKNDLSSDGSLAGGVGLGLKDVDLAIGATGYADSKLKHRNASAGLLFNSRRGDIVLGVSAYGLAGGTDAYGAGITFRVEQNAYLTVDATGNNRLKGKIIRPTLGIRSNSITLMVGYGFEGDKLAPHYTFKGGTGGLGLELGRIVSVQAYYNQLAKYYGGVSVKF